MKIWYRVSDKNGWVKKDSMEAILRMEKNPPIKKITKVTEEELPQELVDEINQK